VKETITLRFVVKITTCQSRQIPAKQEMSAPGDAPTKALQTYHQWMLQKYRICACKSSLAGYFRTDKQRKGKKRRKVPNV
jgi:hypothetical protein